MSMSEHTVLFWLFLGFFSLIGLVATLAITGVIKADAQFRRWAVTGFAAAVVGVVVIWARSQPPSDFFVNLKPPDNVPINTFELRTGTYEYVAPSSPHSGSVELTVGQEVGSWVAKFPYVAIDKAVSMTLTDSSGRRWRVLPFYPNHSNGTLTEMVTQEPPPTPTPVSSLIPIGTAVAVEHVKTKFNNYARATATIQGRTYYDWRVFVDEPGSVLAQIDSVEYLLHPSFPEPLQIRKDPGSNFAVEAHGWGEFTIQIRINFKDGTTQSTSYALSFDKAWPTPPH